jgi:UDP-GlcNAc3NAcA epimerase
VKILTVVGNRPQFIKAAAVSRPLRAAHEEVLVHTGQHYDEQMSAVFFDQLDLPSPDHELGIGGATNTSQTARMLGALEPLIGEVKPDAVLVYGDTNSTLAGALTGAQARVPVVHVEAGMRSYDRAMPEELNRVLTDHMSALLLCSAAAASENLRAESVTGTIEVVGDVMVDVLLGTLEAACADEATLTRYGVRPGEYVLATAHRAGNVDDPERLRRLVELLRALPRGMANIAPGDATRRENTVVFPLHPRTRARVKEAGLLEELSDTPGIALIEPLGYAQLTALLSQARAVVTDSGGVQKEAYVAGVPCITLRANTEWTETVEAGWNTLVDLDVEEAFSALARTPPTERPQLYGDGHAAERCVDAIGRLAAASDPRR